LQVWLSYAQFEEQPLPVAEGEEAPPQVRFCRLPVSPTGFNSNATWFGIQ
jgi:hypothetical protein